VLADTVCCAFVDGAMGEIRARAYPNCRHAELVSASTVQHEKAAIAARWMLKRVQHDAG
jgi:hypothetical protein